MSEKDDLLESLGYQEFIGLKIRNVEKGNADKSVPTPVCAITFESNPNYYAGMNIKLILKGKYATSIYKDYLEKSSLYKDTSKPVNEFMLNAYLSVNVVASFRELRKAEIVFDNPIALGFMDTNIFTINA